MYIYKLTCVSPALRLAMYLASGVIATASMPPSGCGSKMVRTGILLKGQ